MKYIVLTLAFSCLCCISIAEEKLGSPASSSISKVTFRKPFTLKLHIDKEHYYEESYTNKIPYVYANDVYLFSGESFGIKARIEKEEILEITYERDLKKADVELEFSQEKMDDGEAMMILTIKNKLNKQLHMDALMTIPEKKGIYKTNILPVQPGLSYYGSWPHPIVQLVLRNFRLKEKTPNKKMQNIGTNAPNSDL